jgi:hypothetical protein
MSTPTVSIASLPRTLAVPVSILVGLGHTKAAQPYTLTASEAAVAGLGPNTLKVLLKTGLPMTVCQRPLLRFYAVDGRTGCLAYGLNYDLVP